MTETEKQIQELLEPTLECFSGADGGVSFIKLKVLLNEMQKKSNEGDTKATEILLVAKRFSKLIELVKKV